MHYFWILFIVFSHTGTMQKSNKEEILQLTDKDYLLGKFNPEAHPDFVMISSDYTELKNIFLRKEVYEAFVRMYQAAKSEKINLTILSATRNFNYQKGIWERKWQHYSSTSSQKKTHPEKNTALKILKYSAMPGASRHHWGTDIDICNLNSSYFLTPKGKKIYKWLIENAHLYGFCQPYDSKKVNNRTGYNEEKWHWTYQPTSKVFTEKAAKLLQNKDFTDFSGSEAADEIDIVGKYILGINKDCF